MGRRNRHKGLRQACDAWPDCALMTWETYMHKYHPNIDIKQVKRVHGHYLIDAMLTAQEWQPILGNALFNIPREKDQPKPISSLPHPGPLHKEQLKHLSIEELKKLATDAQDLAMSQMDAKTRATFTSNSFLEMIKAIPTWYEVAKIIKSRYGFFSIMELVKALNSEIGTKELTHEEKTQLAKLFVDLKENINYLSSLKKDGLTHVQARVSSDLALLQDIWKFLNKININDVK